jgi:hypothetical protein
MASRGRGKTHLAIAIGYRAIQNGFDVAFVTAAALIDDLSASGRDGLLRDSLATYLRPHVLIVDEVGYLAYGSEAANVLFHVVNDRHIRKRAMVFTTNKDPKTWGAVLHDEDLADAIVDRILERGRLLRLDGPSVRTKHLPPEESSTEGQAHHVRFSGKTAPDFPEPTTARRESTSARLGQLLQTCVGREADLRRHRPLCLVDHPSMAPQEAPSLPELADLRTVHVAKTARAHEALVRPDDQARLDLVNARRPLPHWVAKAPSLRVNTYGEPGA